MSETFDPMNAWLRKALKDARRTQSELAIAWGRDPAQVSKYINYGEPELTLEWAQAIKLMTGMSLDDIFANDRASRVQKEQWDKEQEPQVHEESATQPRENGATQVVAQDTNLAMLELKRSVDLVRVALGPGYTVEIVIKATGY